MAKRVRVRDVDHGFAAFVKGLRALERARPRVITGIVGAGATAPHARKPRTERADIVRPIEDTRPPLTVVQIAQIHEFGLGTMPERSFLRSTFDENRLAYQKYIVNGMRREVLASAQSGVALTPEMSVTLKRIALKVEGDVKRKIRAGVPPPNSPRTIARKGSSTPLVDKGQLIASLGSELRRAGAR